MAARKCVMKTSILVVTMMMLGSPQSVPYVGRQDFELTEALEAWYLIRGVQGHGDWESALGDPGMQDPSRVRLALESWNFCNKVGQEGSGMPSPRQADCANLLVANTEMSQHPATTEVQQLVSVEDNALKTGQPFPHGCFNATTDVDHYAVEKELYLASLCRQQQPWDFWMLMLKNGNFDVKSGLCPASAKPPPPGRAARFARSLISLGQGGFPCFGQGCMNHPLIFHNWSAIQSATGVVSGAFYGTYDLDGASAGFVSPSSSYFSVTWEKKDSGGWQYHHVLRTNDKYPWLMLYLRADATKGLSGGYPWETRGMTVKVPQSPNFVVKLTLNVIKGGGPQSQFYLLDVGGCWKNNGLQCDGDTATDVTRYSEMIINPETPSLCGPHDLSLCPPYHVHASTGQLVHRSNTTHFPYAAYHLYCVPSNAAYAETPFRVCDPYSNPQPQELVQILAHSEWAIHGYPSAKGQGWEGQPSTWTLDVGALSQRLYFYQDPGSPPAVRKWPSIDVGTEIYISQNTQTAEWILSDFDVLVPKSEGLQ